MPLGLRLAPGIRGLQNSLFKFKLFQILIRSVAGLYVSVHHMFQKSNFAQFASKDLPQQYFNDENPSNDNIRKLSKNRGRSIESEIFRAKELTSCPTSLIEYENLERVVLIFKIGENCGKTSMRYSRLKQLRRRPSSRRRKVFDLGFTILRKN